MPPIEDDAALERALTQKLHRKDCPPPEVLGEMRLGMLPAAQADAIRAHLDACPHCQAEVQALDRLLRLEDRERPALRRILGRLVPPSMVAERPAFVLRGNGRLTDATYQAGEFTVMLAIQEDPHDPRFRSVLGVLTSGYQAHTSGTAILAGETGHVQAEIDEDGQFALTRVVPGRYVLDMEVGHALVQLEPLDVQ
jgi:anti-sigma factor RsiW